jgi:hypothetical protein
MDGFCLISSISGFWLLNLFHESRGKSMRLAHKAFQIFYLTIVISQFTLLIKVMSIVSESAFNTRGFQLQKAKTVYYNACPETQIARPACACDCSSLLELQTLE